MKKTLLFFFLFFTTIFYAQVSNIEHCAGDTSFNLTSQKALLIGNLDPAQTTVSYHLSLADATDNLNAIASPANYISTESSKTIYARIDNLGTITTNYFNLIVDPILTANAEVVYVNCVPRIIITGNGGNSTYEYSHFGVTYTQTNIINNPSPGLQTVYVRDGNGCVASKTLVVESLSPLTWLINGTSNIGVTCQGGNDGSIQVTASGGKAPYQYSIGNNEFTSANVFRNLSVGEYTVRIQDATGCILPLNFTMRLLNTAMSVNSIITNDSNSANEGKIDMVVSGGTAPYAYSLKDNNGNPIPSKTTNPFTGLAVGSYEAIVTDSHGCIFSQKGINILNEATPLSTTFAVTPITCVINTGTITITPNGGTLPYQYSIDNGNNYSSSNVFSNLVAGTYNIMVRDAQGFVVSTTATIDPISLPIITTTYKSILCHGDSNGSILVGASNGKAPNLFSINGGVYTSYNLFENLSAGNYVLSVKDSNGCIVTTSVLLEDPAPITAEITYFDRSVTINASGGYGKYEYALDGGNYQQSYIYSNVSYGNHTIYVRDPNNCVLSKPITVVKPVPLASSFAVDKGTVTINTTGGILPYHYALQKASGYPITTTQSNIFTDLINGSYNIIVTDSQGGAVILSDIIISESSALLLTANATSTLITCIDSKGIITVTADGGKSPYQYSLDNQNFTTSNVFSNLTAGNYTITVRDSNNFITTAGVTISSAKPVIITSEIVSEINCNGANDGVIKANVLQGQPPYTYALDSANFQSNNTFRNLSPGIHTINVLDQNGCAAIVSVTLLDPKILKSTVVVNGNTITAYTIDGTAPYNYFLQGTDGFIAGPQTSETFTNLPTGLYSLQITDARGCALLRNGINISEMPVLFATAAISPISCENPKGTITVTATGGSGSYVYSLNNNPNYSVSNVFSDLSPGSYTISVRDSQNATTTITAVIIPVNPLVASAVLIKNIDCVNNATINVTAQGGKEPYLYSLDNGQTYTENNTFTNISAGIYFVRVKDSLDCIAITNTIAIEQLTPLSISATHIDTSAFNSNDGSITVLVNGGTAPYIYSLLNSSNVTIIPDQLSSTFNNLASGTYSVIVKDAKGCISLTQVTILAPSTLTAVATVNQVTCDNPTGTITVTAMGGSGIYEYSIDYGTTYTYSPIFTGLQSGNYIVTVKDSQNSLFTMAIMVVPVNPVYLNATITSLPSCVGPGTIQTIATGGQAPYIYSLNGGAFSPANIFNVYAGVHTLTVRDSNGCTESLAITLDPPLPLVAVVDIENQTITVNTTGGMPPYVYTLQDNNTGATIIAPQTSNIFNNVSTGVYSVQVTDNAGCSLSKTGINISNSNTLSASFSASPATCVNPTGIITVHTSGGLVPYQYSLDGVNYVSSNTFPGLTPGTYTITVRDANNNLNSIIAVLDQVNIPTVSAIVISNVGCKGDNTGSITAVTAGGKAPYTYSLNGGTFNTTNTFSNLRVGAYAITVKDSNGCIATTTIFISEPAEELSATAISINDQGIIMNAKGGTAPYLYSLQDKNGIVIAGPQDNGIFRKLPVGLYGAQVTDANGCGYIQSGVTVIPSPALSATVDILSINCSDPGTITVNATGGFQPYQYSYNNGASYTISNTYSSFTPGNYAIKVRDSENTVVSFSAVLTTGNVPSINLVSTTDVNCKGQSDGSITVEFSGGKTPYTYSLDHGPYIVSANKNMTFTNLRAGNHIITMQDVNGCAVTSQVAISEPASALITVTTVKNQTITINASGGTGQFKYAISPNLNSFSTNNVFSALTPGSYTVLVMDANGCFVTMEVMVDPSAPLINGQNKLTLEFKPGQTLADLTVDGQNIKWYINQNPLSGKTNKAASETPLPLTTVLVDGTTYYASQTINGIESTTRLAVTAKSNGALSTPDFVLPNFTYYPNPVQHTLSISNTSNIDEIEIFSVSGKTVLTKKINSDYSEIDLSNVSSGFYFLKVKSEGQTKTIKIVKK